MDIHDLYQPFLRYFRSRRMRHFQELFSANMNTTILDVGGTGFNWSLLPISPRLTTLNLPGQIEEADASVIADGRCLPFKDRAFDIVFSNSVIEHLGDSASQEAFAREIARVGLGYHVQTPNRLFPFEPHLLTPFVHYLPKKWQLRLLRNFTVLGWVTRPTPEYCQEFIKEIRLLDYTQMACMFPGAQIYRERFLGLTKSLTAVKPPDEQGG